MTKLATVLVLLFVLSNCTYYQYPCHETKAGIEIKNTYKKKCTDCCDRSALGYVYTGYGTISNHNSFPVNVRQWRVYYRNTVIVDVFTLPPHEVKEFYFTGGDRFELSKTDNTLLGVIHASPRSRNASGVPKRRY